MLHLCNDMPRGKPFEKGQDERRHAGGQRNAASVAFSKTLRELIVKEGESVLAIDGKKHKKVELLIRKVWNEALQGKEWATLFIAERTEGKIKDELDAHADMLIRVVHDEGYNAPPA